MAFLFSFLQNSSNYSGSSLSITVALFINQKVIAISTGIILFNLLDVFCFN